MAADDRRVVSAFLYGEDGTPVMVDANGRLTVAMDVISPEIREAYLTSTSTATTIAQASTWNDPGSGGQRGVDSSSTQDNSGGQGIRTLRITYYDGNGLGPFTEDVTTNGTTAAATAATDIRFVEKVEALTVGSNGAAVGNVDITANTNGTGTVLARINAGENVTRYAQHWVPSGTTMNITSIFMGSRATAAVGTGSNGRVILRSQDLLTAGAAVQDVIFGLRLTADQGTREVFLGAPLRISGPNMVSLWERADGTGSTEWFLGFSFYDS